VRSGPIIIEVDVLDRLNRRKASRESLMKKRCHQCEGKLGLGVRFRNLWKFGHWLHLRFCSALCEANYELEQRNANRQTKWISYVGRSA
jgi:hypothetical protein